MTSISSTNPKTFFTKKKRFGFAPYGTDSLQIVGKVHFSDSSQNLIPKNALFLLTNPNFRLTIRTRSPKYGLTIGKRPLRRWHFRAVGELWFYQ